MKTNIKIIGCAICCWVAIGLSSCKAPQLNPNGEVVSLSESFAPDTLFVKPLEWKEFFQDSLLQMYVEIALLKNYSFKQSMERVAMSRANLQRAKGLLLPEIGLNIGASVNRFGEYTMDGVGNSETNTPSLPKDKHIPDPYKDLSLTLNFQWEADIWGKLTRQKQAAAARWMASAEAARFARSILISELAINYYELIGYDKCRDVLRGALVSARRSFELTRQLKEEGAETQLAVDQFHARVLLLESKLLENEQMIKEKERAITCLLGVFPFDIQRMKFEKISNVPLPLSEGIPANLLTLRPDVRAAELELLASKADVMSAKAAFYPSLVLGAGGGFNSFDLGKWFTAPASLIYDLAAGITAPIFKQGQIKAMWNEARAAQKIALSHYHETALNAYTEVLNLYTASLSQQERVRLKEIETSAHRRSVSNATELFKLNYVGFLEVLSADERYLESELERIDIVTDLCRKKILLYRALGGGC
ncbi:MAG: efflux transporter outer membrane subunit [Parabacteroides distasonis]|nr:efflux transporter outer membrane subunit [Parabacteroides distasonis]MBQ4163353.1 efflux transporter outer membrane subunit [Parabacteroides sp.]